MFVNKKTENKYNENQKGRVDGKTKNERKKKTELKKATEKIDNKLRNVCH